MKKEDNIGLIEDTVAGKSFKLAGISNSEGSLKKILLGENFSDTWVKQQFPQTEIVHDAKSILDDAEIDLVIIPETQKEELNVVANILNTGKNVRIV
jgi:hypothetical protein